MNENEKIYKNLHLLLKMFKNRPYHLAKYLIDNNALNQDFLNKVITSEKLSESNQEDNKLLPVYIGDITKMEEFFTSLIENGGKKSKEEITIELNNKLNDSILNEKYEDAARIRDYMKRNGIKRINKNN